MKPSACMAKHKAILGILSVVSCMIIILSHQPVAMAAADLTVEAVDTGGVTTDCQTLETTGTVSAMIENLGSSDTGSGFMVLFFEDANGNGLFDSGLDNALGSAEQDSLSAGGNVSVTAAVSGILAFSNNLDPPYNSLGGNPIILMIHFLRF